MEKDLKYWNAYCYCHWFINWKDIDIDDFWEKYDRDIENADDYCCWNMQFTRYEWRYFKISMLKCMKKYKITKEEFLELCDELEKKLSFWNCGRCS